MIRSYVEATDLPELLDSWYEASLVAHPFLGDEFLAHERVLIAEQWLPSAETMVSIVDGRVVGFLSLVGNEVGAIFVHPDHQGAGLGRELMDDARSKRPFLELDVFEDNPIGRGFYSAYGFEPIGRRDDEETGQIVLRLRFARVSGPRPVFVHETIDVVGQGQYDYMEHLWQDPVQRMPEMTSLQGSFYVLGFGGGRWPQVVNIWDCGDDGWEGWGRNLDRLNLKRRKAFYGDWWDKAAQWRSGGFDRVCGGVPGSPTTAEIAERGIKGNLFVNEVLTVRPGAQLDFLSAVIEERKPLLEARGVVATGLWQVVNNAHEVVLIWATTIEAWVQLRRDIDATFGLDATGVADERLAAWAERSATFVTGGDTHVMTPLPRTVYGPDDWEDADLGQWLGDADG